VFESEEPPGEITNVATDAAMSGGALQGPAVDQDRTQVGGARR
jgi:hypothetical protein